MIEKTFLHQSNGNKIQKGSISVQSPSNIALVKYWGKKPVQIPANSSISFTLKNCYTQTTISFEKSNEFQIDLSVDGKKNIAFLPKIEQFFKRIKEYSPYIYDYKLQIDTHNTFPHSSGIASSASGFSALAYAVVQLEKQLSNLNEKEAMIKASFLSRLGSGSACRSLFGPLAIWGKHEKLKYTSDLYAIEYQEIHDVFKDFQDTILLIDKGQKKVSSTIGHDLMSNHPYAKQRFLQAQENIISMISILKSGNLDEFIAKTESEALTLHGMMMTSNPYFVLMKEGTLSCINKIWEFREEKKIPLCFTLDAGANLHVLYPKHFTQEVLDFIRQELIVYCENQQYICDEVGIGAKVLNEYYD